VATVYQHRRLDTGEVFYIGIGKDASRAYSKKKRNKHWKYIVDKVGYAVDILIEGCSIEDAKAVEIGMISDYGRKDLKLGPLVNMTDGGDGTINHSPEVIKSISQKLVGRKRSVQSIESQRLTRIGTHLSEETKLKISERHKGRTFTENHKRKLSEKARRPNINRRKPIVQLDSAGNVINEFDSMTIAAQVLRLKYITRLSNALKNGTRSAGYFWKYKTV
jgi:hypothetical protein